MKTLSAKPQMVERNWHVIDADGLVLGRLASEVAARLRGKDKAHFTPHVDTGDHIIVINAEKVRVTGRKRKQKIYSHHTGYIGNLKSISFEQQIRKDATKVIEHAVRGMLPKNPLGRAMFRKLKVYAGPTHLHLAQKPQVAKLRGQE